jgi:Skp family chaperone for outer membrane proteins
MYRIVAAALICLAGMAGAQTPPAQTDVPSQQVPSTILTLDQEALFSRSQFGKALRAKIAQDASVAEAETRKIDAGLEVEERDRTEKRAKMSADDFRILADAFDTKVKNLRAEREAAASALRDKEAAARQQFVTAVTQIIGDYMVQRGATAIVDKKAIIVSLLSIDITSDIVGLIDQKLGDGTAKP